MEEVNLKELFTYYLKKLPIIIFVTMVFILVGFFYIKKIQVPMYHGTTTIILVQKSENNSSSNSYQNELNINQKLVSTYSKIIKSRRVSEQVKNNLNLDSVSVEGLANKIDVAGVNDTSIIKVSVSDKDNSLAMKIANEVANVFKREITNIYNLENVSIIDEAIVESTPYNINVKKELLLFILGGLVLSCCVTFIVFYFDNTIKSKKDIVSLDLPVLAEVPSVKKLTKKDIVRDVNTKLGSKETKNDNKKGDK